MRAGSRAGWSVLRDAVRTQLWPIPAVGIALAALAGILLPRLDARIDDDLPPTITDYLFGGGADAARAVLEAIAGSLITVTSLTFSLTVVTLQLASSQFSPGCSAPSAATGSSRERWRCSSDFHLRVTVLRTVRTPADDGPFVPQMAVTVAFLLAVAACSDWSSSWPIWRRKSGWKRCSPLCIRTPPVPCNASFPRPTRSRRTGPDVPQHQVHLLSPASGFLVWIDESALLAAARQADAILVITRQPGSFLIEGVPIGACWPVHGTLFDTDTLHHLSDQAAAAIHTGSERTAAQDITFGLRQLTDVATKALSPGINNHTTAIHALGHTSALLVAMVGRDLGPRLITDEGETIRVTVDRPSLAGLVELAVGPARRYGAADPSSSPDSTATP